MKGIISIIVSAVIIIAILFLTGALYVVNETEQIVITQFGRPIGKPVVNAGLHFKVPFIQQVNRFEKRILEWDGEANQIPTKDKKYIFVDTTARWKITDALKFMQSVNNETGAHARLDDILDSSTKNVITNHGLVEAVRDSNRILETDVEYIEGGSDITEQLEKITIGREGLTREILEEAQKIVPQYGITLIDVRIKRINYIDSVQMKVYERMISERKRAAEQYRSEGQGKKAEIEGRIEKEMDQITSEAYKVAEEIKGNADAQAITIYAQAYNKDPEFYSFLKTLDTYKRTVDGQTTIIMSTDGEYFKYLKDIKEV
ncbi:MAG: protease modulator HflC [Candidatus Omnitrophica bacterium]|nr:protease modulator HflC [Candidatus Omnitrophota bacterium]